MDHWEPENVHLIHSLIHSFIVHIHLFVYQLIKIILSQHYNCVFCIQIKYPLLSQPITMIIQYANYIFNSIIEGKNAAS